MVPVQHQRAPWTFPSAR